MQHFDSIISSSTTGGFPLNCHQEVWADISIKKTEVLFQPARGYKASTPKIKIDGKILNCVDSFTYLGSSLSSSNSLDKEISTRIAKASASYGRLQKRVWCDRGLSIETKCAVYKAVVLSALLYGCESWTLYLSKAHQTPRPISPALPATHHEYQMVQQSIKC